MNAVEQAERIAARALEEQPPCPDALEALALAHALFAAGVALWVLAVAWAWRPR